VRVAAAGVHSGAQAQESGELLRRGLGLDPLVALEEMGLVPPFEPVGVRARAAREVLRGLVVAPGGTHARIGAVSIGMATDLDPSGGWRLPADPPSPERALAVAGLRQPSAPPARKGSRSHSPTRAAAPTASGAAPGRHGSSWTETHRAGSSSASTERSRSSGCAGRGRGRNGARRGGHGSKSWSRIHPPCPAAASCWASEPSWRTSRAGSSGGATGSTRSSSTSARGGIRPARRRTRRGASVVGESGRTLRARRRPPAPGCATPTPPRAAGRAARG
jgi:hypothetical protein